jgi:hypothetical protein
MGGREMKIIEDHDTYRIIEEVCPHCGHTGRRFQLKVDGKPVYIKEPPLISTPNGSIRDPKEMRSYGNKP